MSGVHKTSIICINGHLISSESAGDLSGNEYCRDCGGTTISACQRCHTPIRGRYQSANVLDLRPYDYVPHYCHNCGQPYPWTDARFAKMKSLIALEGNLTADEQSELLDAAKAITVDSPSSAVDASIFRRLVEKAGGFLKAAMFQFASDFASDLAKRILFPNP